MIHFDKILLVALAALSAPAMAQMSSEPAPACTAPGTLPAELAGWGQPHKPIKAAAKASALKDATLALGTAVDATLVPTPSIDFPVDPSKPGGSVSQGGLFAFDIAQAGKYRVALSSGAWIDVIAGKTVAESIAHGRGPDCTGVRKMVDYALQPGRHMLQVSANGGPALTVLVTRLP